MKKRLVSLFLIFLTLFWIFVIFGFSGENSNASSQTSSRVTEALLNFFIKDFNTMDEAEQHALIKKFDPPIRKLAHFSEYAVLGLLVSLTFVCQGFKQKRLFSLSILSCAFLASADEIHQFFVPGRACRFTDVLIDTSGSALGILFITAAVLLFKKIKAAF